MTAPPVSQTVAYETNQRCRSATQQLSAAVTPPRLCQSRGGHARSTRLGENGDQGTCPCWLFPALDEVVCIVFTDSLGNHPGVHLVPFDDASVDPHGAGLAHNQRGSVTVGAVLSSLSLIQETFP